MRKSKNKSRAMAKADRYFSEYIRLRDSDQNCNAICITCRKVAHISEMDAGHFIDRSHKATRYEEQNVNAQCRACNRFQSGRQYEHGIAIDLKYGAGTADPKKSLTLRKLLQSKSYYSARLAVIRTLMENGLLDEMDTSTSEKSKVK